MLRDAQVSQQQFSSQPVSLARSYESTHLKLGNPAAPSLPTKSHLLPLELSVFHFLAQFPAEIDAMYRRRGLLIARLVGQSGQKHVSKKKKTEETTKKKESGHVSANYD